MSAEIWQEVTLGDFVALQRGYDLTEGQRKPGTIPVMGSSGVNGYHNQARASGPGVTIGRSGVGSVGAVNYSKNDYWPHNTVLYVTNFYGNDPLFVYYFLKSLNLRSYDSGSAQASLNRNYIYPLKIRIPFPREQRAIAAVLGALDDKIELNRRTNATLEEIARALFTSWFVDFEPVRAKAEGRATQGMDEATAALFPDNFEETALGRPPRGWTVTGLDTIATYLNGLALQKFPAQGDEYLPVIKIAQLRKGDTEGSDRTAATIPSAYVVEDGDVLFSWSGSLEVALWCGGRGALNQHLFKVTSQQYPKWFYYFWTKYHLAEFQSIAAGKATTMGHIQRHHLSSAQINIPSPELLQHADEIMAPMLDKLIALNLQTRQLKEVRDTLLPKLLSGELRVGDVEGAL